MVHRALFGAMSVFFHRAIEAGVRELAQARGMLLSRLRILTTACRALSEEPGARDACPVRDVKLEQGAVPTSGANVEVEGVGGDEGPVRDVKCEQFGDAAADATVQHDVVLPFENLERLLREMQVGEVFPQREQ